MHSVNLYYSNIDDWDINEVKKALLKEELDYLSSIRHIPTLSRKILNRVLIRSILSKRCGVDGKELVFEYNSRGKPKLKDFPNLHFNISHSQDLVLIGISDNHLIGVDIEKIKHLVDENSIAKNYFSSTEYNIYQGDLQHSSQAFYQFWTTKEAIIKALGKSLWETKDVPEIVKHDNRFFLQYGSKILYDWSIIFLNVHPQYSACVVINHPLVEVKLQLITKNHLSI